MCVQSPLREIERPLGSIEMEIDGSIVARSRGESRCKHQPLRPKAPKASESLSHAETTRPRGGGVRALARRSSCWPQSDGGLRSSLDHTPRSCPISGTPLPFPTPPAGRCSSYTSCCVHLAGWQGDGRGSCYAFGRGWLNGPSRRSWRPSSRAMMSRSRQCGAVPFLIDQSINQFGTHHQRPHPHARAGTMSSTGQMRGLNKGFPVQKLEVPKRPAQRKGVRRAVSVVCGCLCACNWLGGGLSRVGGWMADWAGEADGRLALACWVDQSWVGAGGGRACLRCTCRPLPRYPPPMARSLGQSIGRSMPRPRLPSPRLPTQLDFAQSYV